MKLHQVNWSKEYHIRSRDSKYKRYKLEHYFYRPRLRKKEYSRETLEVLAEADKGDITTLINIDIETTDGEEFFGTNIYEPTKDLVERLKNATVGIKDIIRRAQHKQNTTSS